MNMQKEILPNDVHEGDTNERKKKKCEIRKRKERRRQITREIFYCLLPCIGIVLRNANAARCWRTDAIGGCNNHVECG